MNSGLFTVIVEWDQSYGGKEFWGGVDSAIFFWTWVFLGQGNSLKMFYEGDMKWKELFQRMKKRVYA